MVLENCGFVVGAEGSGNAAPFFAVEDDAAEEIVDGVGVVEAQGVLGYHVEGAAEGGEGFAVD